MEGQAPPTSQPRYCLFCRKPLAEPSPRRRYCSDSCRTQAYNVRSTRRLTLPSDKLQALPAWIGAPDGELPLLSNALRTLEGVASAAQALARQFEAEKLALRRALDKVRSQLNQQAKLEQALAQAQSQLAERDAELHRLRQLAGECEDQERPAPEALTAFPAGPVPDRLRDGLALIGSRLEVAWKFGEAQVRRTSDATLASLVSGLAIICGSLRIATENLDGMQGTVGLLSASGLRWCLLHDVVPAFDDLYRCVRALRVMPPSTPRASLPELLEWSLRPSSGVLQGAGLRPFYPVGERFDPHHHEAAACVDRSDLPDGTIAHIEHIGFRLDGKLFRPARVAVVRTVASAAKDQ